MRILALVLFGLSFGFVEAAVVVYARAVYEPLRAPFHPGVPPTDLFPLLTLDQLARAGPDKLRLLYIEIVREAATLAMLGAIALAVSRKAVEWLAAFVVAFGVWDIAFYLSLKLAIDWPASLFTWDVLFLIPVPWYGPVLAPLLVAVTMVVSGCSYLRSPVPIRAAHWAAIFLGAFVLTVAFCWDWRNLAAGGLPNPFPWPIFGVGWSMSAGGFAHAVIRSRSTRPSA